jgi:hypothetical protein
MRKGLHLLVFTSLFFWGALQAQNLVVNGDLESWTGGQPDGWTVIENIAQETTTVHGGTSSARHTSEASTKDFQQVIGGIQEGQEYTISYWYYDNDPNARTRIWSYWTAAGANLPDNADELRPSTYSEDNPGWIQFNVVLTAPATADGFKFEVRVYNQDGNVGGSVFYDDFEFTGDVVINPEPSNYPTAFVASASGLAVDLSWIDATGTQLPSGYIIMAGDNSSLPVPVDGTPVPNDLDLSDGSGALNVTYGTQSANFPFLNGNTTYYFTIYPYTNSGANIDYKTDGTAPTANAATANFTVIETENFDNSWGNWQTISVIGAEVWDRDNTYGINSTPCAQMSGYAGGPLDNEDWLISPALDFDNYDNESLVFYTAMNYTGPELECLISEDYSGTGDPNAASWENLSFTPSSGSWVWTESGTIDVSSYNGMVHIAFKYTSNTTNAATWEVDDITITGEEDIIIDPEPSNYPTDFTATPAATYIDLSWTDATGTQLPDAYIVYASTSSSLPVPVDGTPVANDPDLSDGNGALNVVYGLEEISFTGLDAATTYYFTIYPYTNSGSNIDFKTDGTAPTAQATTTVDPEPTSYPTAFTASAGSTSINLNWTDATGAQLPVAYIIFAGTDASLPTPVDGTPVEDDLDLSDGSGALNVPYGSGQASFSGLTSATTYYFVIYPYTNSGASINYKTDGTAPITNATTTYSPIIIEETFDDSWGGWNPVSVLGAQVWDRNNTYGINNTPCARMSGFSGGAVVNEDWLISPVINMNNYETVIMTFFTAKNYDGDDLQLKVSTNYSGNGDPNAASWTNLSFVPSPGTWEWTNSGEVDLSSYNGNSVYVAFLYTCDNVASATWEVDNILIEEVVTYPEPSNYPSDFEASATGTSIHLNWTDAIGTQLPEAYIVLAGTSASLPTPADGTPIADDTDLSDGSGALNVPFGNEETTFSGLDPATTYYFAIYPYTNSGSAIDYKNDGTAPTANATTTNVNIVTIEYENFDDSWGNWTTLSVTGSEVWTRDNSYGINNSPCAQMSGYNGGFFANEDWLISPALNLNNYENEKLTFYNAANYSGPDLELKVSTDYSGSGDPNAANWTDLTYTLSPGTFTWTLSGEVDISAFNGSAVYVAFKYTSTTSAAKTWEIDEILITGEEETTIDPEPTNYPTEFTAAGAGTSVHLNWTDATGEQLPDAYIILAGLNASLPVPVDGTPIPDDTDLSDGSGALNIAFGQEEASFGNLAASTNYYFTIYSYTNSGSIIDYKNDGTAPAANATTGNVSVVTIEYENFDDSWGNWTTISVAGSQVWSRDNSYGINNTPCAQMSGYSGGFFANEDWLISPALNLDNYENEKLTFYNASNYSGPDLELKVSTDYSGSGDPNAATWSTLSYTMSPGTFTWTLSGEVDLSSFNGNAVYIAFKFTSTASSSKTWEIDEILITGEEETTIDPEPTNYPTAFAAGSAGTSIILSWTDATGETLPDAYLIFAGTDASLPMPEDGIPVPDDTNLSDGNGALNIDFGDEQATFTGLDQATTYYFAIYSYTNTGVNTDYKNDGTAPTTEATTGISPVIEYQNFDEGFDDWITVSVNGAQQWQVDDLYGFPNPPCGRMNGYSGGPVANEDWLISPALNLSDYDDVIMTFYNAKSYDGPDMELKVSQDYSGSGNPNTASWDDIPYTLSTGFFEWTESGEIDLSDYNGSAVYVAFRYTSTDSQSATWEVDEILIKSTIVLPEPTNYPTNFSADGTGSSILVTWTDATGSQIPDGYVVYGSTDPSLPVPVDGNVVTDDADLSDGYAAVNVAYGVKEVGFGSLPPNTTFYFTIYPYTNIGTDIDYKTDGTPPTDNASSGNVTVVTIEEENFNSSWGNWTPVSVIGEQVWDRNNTYGPDFSPCAQMSGYDSGNFENEDWLISPPLNLDNFQNEKLEFMNAKNYSGPNLEVKVSEDYDGSGDPNSATWTTKSFTLSGGSWSWVSSGQVSLDEFSGNAVYVAFFFTSTSSASATWELDDIVITGEEEYVVQPEPTNYPVAFTATGMGNIVKTTWTDATGEQLPDGYVIFASTSDNLPVPTDGLPVQIDSDLADGEAALMVDYGQGEFTFSKGLQNFTTYYFAIYPFTNVGTDINYKNDGIAPQSSAQTTAVEVVTIEEEDFNADWGNWTRINLVGDQEWDRGNSFGLNGSACASMSGYSNQNYYDNDDWLISPAMDFDTYINEKLVFYNAKNYSGPDLEVLISTDYDGGTDPTQASWENLDFNPSTGGFEWTESGAIDLSGYEGSSVYIAFRFTSTTASSATWELDNITITGEIEIGVPENLLADGINLYPNPAHDRLTISQNSDVYDIARILNGNGLLINTVEMSGFTTQIDLSGIQPGIYFVQLIDNENSQSIVKKVVIK